MTVETNYEEGMFRPIPGYSNYMISENGYIVGRDGQVVPTLSNEPMYVRLKNDKDKMVTVFIHDLINWAYPKILVDKSPLRWVTVTEFPDYEINAHGTVRNHLTNFSLPIYRGKDYEYKDCVWMWRNGMRECRTIDSLLRTAFEVTELGFPND